MTSIRVHIIVICSGGIHNRQKVLQRGTIHRKYLSKHLIISGIILLLRHILYFLFLFFSVWSLNNTIDFLF